MKQFYYINLILMGFCCNGYAFNDTTIKGNCNVVVTGKVEGSITCQNIPEKALETLNKLLSSPDKINEMFDSARTIQNLNDLVSLKEEKLRKTELTLQEKITIANDWSKKYQELEQRLKDETDDLSKQALIALQNGDLIKAGELLDKSIEKREQQVDKLAEDHFTRAKVFELQFEPVKALPHFKKAYTYRPDNLNYSFDYAVALQKQNNFKTAESVYIIYLKKVRKFGNQENIASVLNNLGELYRNTQKLKQAEQNFQEALEIRQTLIKTNSQTNLSGMAMILNNLGILYRDTQRLKEAEHSLQEALKIYRILVRDNPQSYLYNIAILLNNLGIFYTNVHKLKEAEQNYQEALEIRRKLAVNIPQVYLPDIAETLNNLGNLYIDTQRLKEAEQSIQEALEIYRTLAKTNPQTYLPDVAATLNNFGGLYLLMNNAEKAENYSKESLDIRRISYKENPTAHGDHLAIILALTVLSKKDSPEFCSLLKEAFQVAHLKDLKETILEIGKTCNLTP